MALQQGYVKNVGQRFRILENIVFAMPFGLPETINKLKRVYTGVPTGTSPWSRERLGCSSSCGEGPGRVGAAGPPRRSPLFGALQERLCLERRPHSLLEDGE